MSVNQLVADITELSKRLGKFYEFYYSLIEAKSIKLEVKEWSNQETIECIMVDKAEWERWKKVSSIIDNFESP